MRALEQKEISKAVISRLPRYYRYLGELLEEGVEISLPQCAAAPAAEGCPVFILPLEEKEAPS